MNVIPHYVKKHYGSKTSLLQHDVHKKASACVRSKLQLVKFSTELSMSVHDLLRSLSQMGEEHTQGFKPPCVTSIHIEMVQVI